VDPVLGGIVVEREQHVEVLGDLRDCHGPLRPVVGGERPGRLLGVVLVLGVPDLRERGLRAGLGGLGQAVEDVGDLVAFMPTSA
jgi:hypothetical protein